MSKAEILTELRAMGPEDRAEVLHLLWELQDQDPITGSSTVPTEHEKHLLDEALEDYEKHRAAARPWEDVMADLRASGQ